MPSNNKFNSDLMHDKDDHEEKSSHLVSSIFLLSLLGFYMLLAFVARVMQNDMPVVVRERDIPKKDWKTFSEESATKYLYRILGDQARVPGTVPHFVRARDLKWLIEEVTARSFNPVHTDWQYVSGNYWLQFNTPHVNSYNNVSNIIAVLEGESGVSSDSIGTSLLVNCHYDSVPFAIGASDNGVFCAAMVEILSKLSRRKQKFKHNIIFLFNGAEENILLGSHGFLSHPWSKNLIGVVNLDSAGMNGRPSVFQVTDPRFLSSYLASRPSAQGLGQMLFSSGIIPSDTDFRIFRDFGNMTGIDIAFTEWGHVYHTRNDRPGLIQNGVIQNGGDTLLVLLIELADNMNLANKEPPSVAVYYDYCHLFLITYSQTSAQIIDLLVSILGLCSVWYYLRLFGMRWSVVKDLLWSVVSRLVSIVGGVLFVGLLTLVTILIHLCIYSHMQMRYLSYNWMVIPLYWLPYFIAHTATSHHYEPDNKVSRSIHTLRAMTATRLYLSVLLFVLSFIPSVSNGRYVITVVILMSSVCSFVSMTLVRYSRLSGLQHFLLEVALSIPLTLFTLSLSTRLVALLAPMMGRSGNDSPDLVMAGVNAGLAAFVGLGLSGIELLCNTRGVFRTLCVLSVGVIVAMITPIGVYKGDVLQRHYWFHTQVTTYNASFVPIEVNSGILITKIDPYTIESARQAIKESPFYINGENQSAGFIKDGDIKYINGECDDVIYCNLPSFRPRFDKYMRKSLFIHMEPPNEFDRSLKLANKKCGENECVLSFIMKGPAFNTITMYSPFNITGWSFEPDVKPTTFFKHKPVYVVVHSSNTYVEDFDPLEFNITIQVPHLQQKESLVEISHHAHKIYNPKDFTEKYNNLLKHMPEYFNIATFISFRDNYVF